VVRDLYKMLSFYTEIFHLSPIRVMIEPSGYIAEIAGVSVPAGSLDLISIKLGVPHLKGAPDIILELISFREPLSGEADEALDYRNHRSHIALTVSHLEDICERACSSPFYCSSGAIVDGVCYLRDPEGNLLELVNAVPERKAEDKNG